MLTKGQDNVPGTAGNDTIIGSVGAGDLNTFSVLDIINGTPREPVVLPTSVVVRESA